jgi:hypothetical protein
MSALSPELQRSETMKLNGISKLIAIAAVGGIAILCALPAGRVSALPGCPGCRNLRFTFGMVGITPGQTARLNVVNAIPPGPPNIPPGPPIRVTLMFVDSNGNPFNIGDAPSRTTVTLLPGQSTFLDLALSGDALPVGAPGIQPGTPARLQMRALISDCEGCSRGVVVPTLEVFDNATGKTTLVMPDTPAIKAGDED